MNTIHCIWIPISKELPPKNEVVIVVFEEIHNGVEIKMFTAMALLNDFGEWYECLSESPELELPNIPVYWMPKPQIPK